MWTVYGHILCPRLDQQLCSVFIYRIISACHHTTLRYKTGEGEKGCCRRGVARSSTLQVRSSRPCAAQRQVGGGLPRRSHLQYIPARAKPHQFPCARGTRPLDVHPLQHLRNLRRIFKAGISDSLIATIPPLRTSSSLLIQTYPPTTYTFGIQRSAQSHTADRHVR